VAAELIKKPLVQALMAVGTVDAGLTVKLIRQTEQ
jgi:hypothetical protein